RLNENKIDRERQRAGASAQNEWQRGTEANMRKEAQNWGGAGQQEEAKPTRTRRGRSQAGTPDRPIGGQPVAIRAKAIWTPKRYHSLIHYWPPVLFLLEDG
ncbi:hypothetical protein TNCV_4131141, partial [Trichonephila clavipes]